LPLSHLDASPKTDNGSLNYLEILKRIKRVGSNCRRLDNKPINPLPPIRAILHIAQEPTKLLGKKRKKGRGKSVNVEPESAPFPEAGWNKDTEAFGHALDCAIKEEFERRIES